MVEIVPATAEMLVEHCKRFPVKTVRAIAGIEDGKVLGLAGYYLANDSIVVWTEIKPEGWKRKRDIVRGYRLLLAMVLKKGIPVVALCDDAREGAKLLLEHVGFRHFRGNLYRYEGGRHGNPV